MSTCNVLDWKFKHFRQQRIYAGDRNLVFEAARSYLTNSLGWKVTESANGLNAQGYSFSHAAQASLKIETTGDGNRMTVDLAVERAGPTGFMLFDVGGYYNIQIRKWLDGIQWAIHQQLSTASSEQRIPHVPTHNRFSACLFNGLLGFIAISFGLYFLIQFISALVGEFTGTLYLMGKGKTLVLHCAVARIVSSLILALGLFVIWQLKHKKRAHPV